MTRVVLIGSNIAHSRSPRLHNHLFALYELPLVFELMPLDEHEVADAVNQMKRGEGGVTYRGANVTSPHKRAVLPAIDRMSPEAARIGAVNTIVFEGGGAVGHNTDAVGFARPLRGHALLEAPFAAAVLGTGGAAMAAVHALLEEPMLRSLTLYSRSRDRARRVAAQWVDARVTGDEIGSLSAADLLVQATPVGLSGQPGMPVQPSALAGVRLLYEMVYSPAETALVHAARAQGVETIGGGPMFVAQALHAFELWTGIMPDESDVPVDLFVSE